MRRNISRCIVLMTFNALLGLLSIRLYADLTLGFCQICCLLHNLTSDTGKRRLIFEMVAQLFGDVFRMVSQVKRPRL